MNNLNNLNFIISFPLVNTKKHTKAFIFSQICMIISETNKTKQGSRNAPGVHFGSGAAFPLVHLLSPDHRTLDSSLTRNAPGETHCPTNQDAVFPLRSSFPKVGHQQECLISTLVLSTSTHTPLSIWQSGPASKLLSIKLSFFPSWLFLKKLNSRTSLISPKGSEGKPCHLRSKYEYFNEEESTLDFSNFWHLPWS